MVKPRNDYVAVKRDEPEKFSPGGIALPNLAEDVSESPQQGIVLDVGPKATELEVGQRVLIGSFAGWTFKVGGEPVVLIKEADVLGVVEK